MTENATPVPGDWDPAPPDRRPFRLDAWIDAHRDQLVPPVANKQVFRQADMIVMVVGGGNQRNDFHDDPREEFFHQIRGDMDLVIWRAEGEEPFHLPIREGEIYLLPAGVRHSPQRPDPDSVGLVIEYQRPVGELDGFEWACFECAHLVHRVEIQVQSIDGDLPPLFASFDADVVARTCPNCGAVHPGTGARL